MGKWKRSKGNYFAQKKREKRNQEKNGGDNKDEPKGHQDYQEVERENQELVTYYKQQKLFKDESEFNEFLQVVRKNLPATFRVTGSRTEAHLLAEYIKKEFFSEYFKAVSELHTTDEEKVEPPKCLPWYPGELAWQLNLSRRDIRRSEPLFRLHNFLITETTSGNISRQEAVSMIPPLVMDVQSHHKVLDMCAAPGSKTAQIIEALHNELPESALPKGFVIANDIDNKRCYMLVHQAKRLNSPSFMVMNTDSANFPKLTVDKPDGTKGMLKFDRILCDVPCSGDGTLRKNVDIWQKWNVMIAPNLHSLQHKILKRGLELLEVGGRLVYSTCSLNPVENEAVIARILQESAGTVELVDVSKNLEGLKFLPGLESWELCGRDLVFYKNHEEVGEQWRSTLRSYLFPPKPEDAKNMHLNRCIRVLPHYQDTGGFFVAALTKTAYLPWEKNLPEMSANTETIPKEAETSPKQPPKKKKKISYGFREDPYVFFDKTEPVFQQCKDFYQLSDNFNPECLLTRCATGKKKHIYFCTEAVKNVVVNNSENVKIINTGVKTFTRADQKQISCSFRLTHEGLDNVVHLVGDARKLRVEKSDLIHILTNIDPKNAPEISTVSEELASKLSKIENGSCILVYNDEKIRLNIAAWKGAKTVRAYIDVNEAVHDLRLLGADVSMFEKNKFKKEEPENEGAEVMSVDEEAETVAVE